MSSLRIVVLTCGELGVRVANALTADGASQVVGLVVAPFDRRPRKTLRAKFRHVIRMQGWRGLVALMGSKIASLARVGEPPVVVPPVALAPDIERFEVTDFHSPESLSIIAALRADLAILAGTYILKESVFALPEHGSINLHSGKVPEYRGAAPAFWELYHGERAVGITIHRVDASLDAGPVLALEMFPIDPAPGGDPLAYIERFRQEVLGPNGVRMLVETVRSLAQGTAQEIPQNHAVARTFRSPDYRAVRELRTRVKSRRRGGSTK